MTTRLWQHSLSGDVFAITTSPTTGRPIKATGPLHYSEHYRALLGDYDGSEALAYELVTNDSEYNRHHCDHDEVKP